MNKINLKVSNLTFKGINPEEKQKIEDSTSLSVDEEKSNAAKYAIGATALAAIVVGGIASKGRLWGKEVKNSSLKDLNEQSKNACKELTEEGKKIYTEFKENLNGKISCRISNTKSDELKNLGEYYHIQEMEANKIKDELIKKGKLNYQIEVEKNRIIVENGQIKELLNENGKPWQISEKTDKNFVKKLTLAVNEETDKRFNQYINELQTKEGLKYLEENEKSLASQKAISDAKNESWLEEQHNAKEQEYSQWWNKELASQIIKAHIADRLETIGLYAKHSKLNDELIIDGQKVVFSKGKLVKVIDSKGKEIAGDETLDLEFIKKLEQSLARKFELETVVPNLRKEIKTATNIYKKHIKNAKEIFKDVEQLFGKEITRKVGKNIYTLKYDKYGDELLEVMTSDGKKIRIEIEDSTMEIENYKYHFKKLNGKELLIKLDNVLETCNIGDITSYRIPQYRTNRQAEVYYKMPHHYILGEQELMPHISMDSETRFFTDLNKYYSKSYLGA